MFDMVGGGRVSQSKGGREVEEKEIIWWGGGIYCRDVTILIQPETDIME